jgi:hypothetical protein
LTFESFVKRNRLPNWFTEAIKQLFRNWHLGKDIIIIIIISFTGIKANISDEPKQKISLALRENKFALVI